MHTIGANSQSASTSPLASTPHSHHSASPSAAIALPLAVNVQSPWPTAGSNGHLHSSIPAVTRRKEEPLLNLRSPAAAADSALIPAGYLQDSSSSGTLSPLSTHSSASFSPASLNSTASSAISQLAHYSPSHITTSLNSLPTLPLQSTVALSSSAQLSSASSSSSFSPSISSSSSSTMSTPINERAKEKQSIDYALKSLIAGAAAGATAKTVVAPLDRVKILFQAHNPNVAKFRGHLLGVFEALREIIKQDGILGAYRGHSAILTRIMPYAGLNYMFYEQYKRVLLPIDPNEHGHFQRVLAGSLAGATAVFFTYPLDLVHSRMAYQVKSRKYTSISQTIRTTFEEEGGTLRGIRALYRGFGPTMLGILPYAGVSFSTYDTLKTVWLKAKVLRHKHANEPKEAGQSAHTVDANDLHRYSSAVQLSIYEKLSCGALAGACAQTVSYPLDVVRRRMQVKGLSNEFHYKSTVDGLKTILRVEGWRGLFVGLSINYLKVAPSHAVSFITYEYMKQILGIH